VTKNVVTCKTTDNVFDAFKKGAFTQVPMIIGDVSQDALLFVYKAINFSLSDVDYETIVTFIFGEEFISVNEKYTPPIFGDKRPLLSILGTDYIFSCATRYIEELVSASSPSVPLYLYQWDHAIADQLWGPTYYYCYGQVCHASELLYEFMGYFTNFAHSGNPNIGPYKQTLDWPLWNKITYQNMHFATPQNDVQTHFRADYCNFWDEIGFEYGW